MSAGAERLRAVTAEATPWPVPPGECLDCRRLMRAHHSRPNGMPAHAGHGLCATCYRQARVNGPGAAEHAANLTEHPDVPSNFEPLSPTQLSRCDAMLRSYISQRRQRGIPPFGLPVFTLEARTA